MRFVDFGLYHEWVLDDESTNQLSQICIIKCYKYYKNEDD